MWKSKDNFETTTESEHYLMHAWQSPTILQELIRFSEEHMCVPSNQIVILLFLIVNF